MNKSSIARAGSLLIAAILGGFISQELAQSLELHAANPQSVTKSYKVVTTDDVETSDAFNVALNNEASNGWVPILSGKSQHHNYIIFRQNQ
jgi:hypothetical protein